MQISEVLGSTAPPVRIVGPNDTIADTVDMLAEYGIGAVVVSSDGAAIEGIISERDVVRYLAREQEGTLRVKVEDLMTRTVSTCTTGDDVDATIARMIEGRFRHMPVVAGDGSLHAMVSLGDLAHARLVSLTS